MTVRTRYFCPKVGVFLKYSFLSKNCLPLWYLGNRWWYKHEIWYTNTLINDKPIRKKKFDPGPFPAPPGPDFRQKMIILKNGTIFWAPSPRNLIFGESGQKYDLKYQCPPKTPRGPNWARTFFSKQKKVKKKFFWARRRRRYSFILKKGYYHIFSWFSTFGALA